MAWIKSKCGKFEAEFKKLSPSDIPDGWDADPTNLPANTRRLEDTKEARRKVLDELATESQNLGLYEAQEEPKKEKPKDEKPKKSRGRGRGKRKQNAKGN